MWWRVKNKIICDSQVTDHRPSFRAANCVTATYRLQIGVVSAENKTQIMECKIWDFHGGHYEECRLLGYKNPVRTSEETHYVSATEPNRLMLRRIWGFHSTDQEVCRLLGYKNPVRTSKETYYFPATEPSRLILCKIWGFHCCDYEVWRLLGFDAVS
jgi:hypothetical protein